MISRTFKRRILSIIFLLPITIFAVYEGGLFFKIFVAIAFGIAVREWFRMTKKTGHLLRDGIIGFIYLFFCFYFEFELSA